VVTVAAAKMARALGDVVTVGRSTQGQQSKLEAQE